MTLLSPRERVLQQADPAVHRKVQILERHYPQLNGRALRAGFLAAGGAVQPAPGSPDQAYHVASSNGARGNGGQGNYIVELDAEGTLKRGTCTCPDYFNGLQNAGRGAPRIEGNPKCKHILAAVILRAIAADEKASAQGRTETEAHGAARGSIPSTKNRTTEREDSQLPPYPDWEAIKNPQSYDDLVARHNYVSGFYHHMKAHPEAAERRWGIRRER